MATLRITNALTRFGRSFAAGQLVNDLDVSQEWELVAIDGLARVVLGQLQHPYDPDFKPSEVAQVKALVSEAGNITAAALLTTTGTLGQVVRLSDGPDKGAILMWSTPAGSSTPQWCWWLWPQASYL